MRIVVPAKVWSSGFSRKGLSSFNDLDHSDALVEGRVLPAEAGTPNSGFTMVEIAIAVAVIAFALVAIIGILPAGLQVQKENREDTLMAQDGTYWMEAIRNGSVGLDDLTNYVSRIEIVNNSGVTNAYTDFTSISPSGGAQVIGLLSTTGTVNTATVRAMAGALSEKGSATADLAFRYKLQVTIFPFASMSPVQANPPAGSEAFQNEVLLPTRLREVRLLFRWPILPNGTLGNGRQVLRCLVSGEVAKVSNSSKDYYFLRP